MLEQLGITHWKPHGIVCPPGISKEDSNSSLLLVEMEQLRTNFSHWMSEEYLASLHAKMKNIRVQQHTDSSLTEPFTIAAHIRRGDLDLCFGRPGHLGQKHRYLPNAFHYATIDDIIAKKQLETGKNNNATRSNNTDIDVTIFLEDESGKNTTESLETFRDRGYRIYEGGDESYVWKLMVQSDVLVLSNSYFSILPAILRTHDDVYFPVLTDTTNPEHHQPMPSWILPSERVSNITIAALDQLHQRCPIFPRVTAKNRL